MTDKIQRIIEDLTRDCTKEEKAKILHIVGAKKTPVKFEYTNEEFERIKPIINKVLDAISEEEEELKRILKIRYEEPIEREAANQGEIKSPLEI